MTDLLTDGEYCNIVWHYIKNEIDKRKIVNHDIAQRAEDKRKAAVIEEQRAEIERLLDVNKANREYCHMWRGRLNKWIKMQAERIEALEDEVKILEKQLDNAPIKMPEPQISPGAVGIIKQPFSGTEKYEKQNRPKVEDK